MFVRHSVSDAENNQDSLCALGYSIVVAQGCATDRAIEQGSPTARLSNSYKCEV